ncbi:hypothetical protein ACO229_03145 [Promicromonospora sp. MS192]|uniref:hypothetical protein n=1 Tax=Promicromonospora sp. MS192 TaxID=3412684 RepID=UPI003C2FA8BB
MPQAQVRRPGRVGSLLGSDQRGELGDAQAVLGHGLGVAHAHLPPPGPAEPFEHAHLVREVRDARRCGVGDVVGHAGAFLVVELLRRTQANRRPVS